MKKLITFSLALVAPIAIAGNDPACVGKNQDVCDTLGTMLLAKGKFCKIMYTVVPVSTRDGGNTYRIECQETSTSDKRVTYVLAFGPGNQSYNVY